MTIGPQVHLAELRRAISAKLVETLGISWEERYGQLVAYKDRFGDCNVPTSWQENPRLARWVVTQRTVRKANKLDEVRIRRLDELGFVWNPLDAGWEEMFAALAAYKAKIGDCNVPMSWQENSRLATWVVTQRRFRKTNKLNKDRIRCLDEVGFVWDPIDTEWEEMFAELVAYRDRFGDCNVPTRWLENPRLSHWVKRQRTFRKANRLDEDRIRCLDELGFVWDTLDAGWEELFAALVAYRNRFGDCNVPKTWLENRTLGSWVNTQRMSRKANKLDEARIRRLDALGFEWHLRKKRTKSDP